MSFRSYALSKRIYEIGDNKIYKKPLIEKIDILYEAHKRIIGCNHPLTNLTNKMVEDFKVSERFLKEDLYIYKNPKNEFERSLFKIGEENLKRIERILNLISYIDYEGILLRSLRRKEVCVYNVNSIRKEGENIYVKSINEFCENFLEYDYIKLFTKLKKMGEEIDFMKCITYVCNKEKFSSDSYNLILACVSFPYEFIRVISKYRDLGRNNIKFRDKFDFDSVLRKDGKSLV